MKTKGFIHIQFLQISGWVFSSLAIQCNPNFFEPPNYSIRNLFPLNLISVNSTLDFLNSQFFKNQWMFPSKV